MTSRSSETFDELADRLGSMYAAGAFDRALSELDEHAPIHPDHDVDVAHLRACFLSLTGRPAEAVAVFDRQLARGGWWAEPLLRFDPDLPQTQPADAAVRAAAGRGVRVATWIGAEDDRLDGVTELDGRLRDAGVLVTEEIDPGIGHRMPDDLAERLPGIVSFVLGD